MGKLFRDLEIVEPIRDRCFVLEGNKARIYFRVSEPPPLGWAFTFTQVWKTVEYPLKSPAGMEDGALWIECNPDEVREHHLPELENAVKRTNTRYRLALRDSGGEAWAREQSVIHTQAQIDDLNSSFHPASPNASRFSVAAILGKIRHVFSKDRQ
jgi:hypothetical protein